METVISEVAQTNGIELKLEQEKAIRGFIQVKFHYQQVLVNLLLYGLLPGTFDGLGSLSCSSSITTHCFNY